MLYTDIYALILQHLPSKSVSAFTRSCSEFHKLFWERFDFKHGNYALLRRAVMQQAVEAVAKILASPSLKEIPVAVLKLAILTRNSDVVGLLLQHGAEIDETCICLAVRFRDVELCGRLLQAAKRPVLCSNHIFVFYRDVDAISQRAPFAKVVRSSQQYRQLQLNPMLPIEVGTPEFPELHVRGGDVNSYVARVTNRPSMFEDIMVPFGIDLHSSPVEKAQRIVEVIRGWVASDVNPYSPQRGSLSDEPLDKIGETPVLTFDDSLGMAIRTCRIETVRELIADKERWSTPEYYFKIAFEPIRKLMLEVGFVTLKPEIVGEMYRSSRFELLLPYWLNGKALPTAAMRYEYRQPAWMFDVVMLLCDYHQWKR